METGEFITVTRAVVARLAPKLSERQAAYVQSATRAGAWEAAIPDLTGYLVEGQIPVTVEDREDLRKLLAHLKESGEYVDQLNVEPDVS